MKKRNLKALALNKKSISNFSFIKGKGGTEDTITCGVSCPAGNCIESVTYCTHDTCGTCIETHCEGGVVCNLIDPKGKK